MKRWPCTRVGQERIVALLHLMVIRNSLHPAGARAIVSARNWQGALIVLRYLNLHQGALS